MIYIVEDDASIRELEQYALQTNGYQVQGFEDGRSFWAAVRQSVPDLVILDVMLPDEDGYQILARLREDAATRSVPVLMVTAKSSEIDVVKGLDKGADDYLCKPFGIMEFISRVRAVLRRAQSGAASAPAALRFGPIALDDVTRTVTVEEEPVELTFKEYALLHFFLEHPEEVPRARTHHEGRVGYRRPAGVAHHRHACAHAAPETWRSGREHPHRGARWATSSAPAYRKAGKAVRAAMRPEESAGPAPQRMARSIQRALMAIGLLAVVLTAAAAAVLFHGAYGVQVDRDLERMTRAVAVGYQSAETPDPESLAGYLPGSPLRLTLIDADGSVLFDSEHKDETDMDNHLSRPEISEALQAGEGPPACAKAPPWAPRRITMRCAWKTARSCAWPKKLPACGPATTVCCRCWRAAGRSCCWRRGPSGLWLTRRLVRPITAMAEHPRHHRGQRAV